MLLVVPLYNIFIFLTYRPERKACSWDPVVQSLDNAIQRRSVNKTNHAILWRVIYPVDSVIHFSNNQGLNSRSLSPPTFFRCCRVDFNKETMQSTGNPPRSKVMLSNNFSHTNHKISFFKAGGLKLGHLDIFGILFFISGISYV